MKLYLAPLEGITSYIYRKALYQCFDGFDKYFIPFIRAKQNLNFSGREKKDISPENNSGMYAVPQILTRNADDFLRTAIPDISLTTDIIVGFPGETEEDFEETLDVVSKCGYDTAFTFLYSRRSGTPAAEMEQIPQDVAKERFNRLLALVQQEGRIRSSRFEGSVQEVLVEEESREKGIFTGRTEYNLLVHFPGTADLLGKYVKVSLDECHGFYYMGSLVEE